jgi:hypothetical protein
MYQSFIPSFLPVMNSQQQLAAIYPDFGEMNRAPYSRWSNGN